jgi:hypothetical protein
MFVVNFPLWHQKASVPCQAGAKEEEEGGRDALLGCQGRLEGRGVGAGGGGLRNFDLDLLHLGGELQDLVFDLPILQRIGYTTRISRHEGITSHR